MWNFDIVLRELKRSGKTQKGLAEHLGVSEQRVSEWKSGRIKSSWVPFVSQIAEFIGVSPMTFDDDFVEDIKKPATISDDGLNEINSIFNELSPDNRPKLLELARLYLEAQRKNSERQ